MKKPNSSGIKMKTNWVKVTAVPLMFAALTSGQIVKADDAAAKPATVVDQAYLDSLVKRLTADEAQIQKLNSDIALKNGNTPDNTAAAMPTYPNLQFHGFGDVSYHASSRIGGNNASGVTYNPPADHAGNSFYTGEMDLFLQSQLADDFSVLNETVIASGTDNHWGMDVERLVLSWKPSEYFNVDMGRFHTAMGYYNTAYHHGTWFQNAIARPNFLEYEDSGGLLPVHSVGISMHGAIPSGKLNLQYFVEIANGRDYNTNGNGAVQNNVDQNGGKAFNFALIAKPDWFTGGQFGLGAYYDQLSVQGQPRTDELILNAHVVYHSALWELMAEGFLQRHHSNLGGEHYTPMFYVQAARKFGKYTPYARFTYSNASANDPVYSTILNQGGLHYGPSLGLRYDISSYVALKLQYDYAIDTGFKDSSEVTFQASFTF